MSDLRPTWVRWVSEWRSVILLVAGALILLWVLIAAGVCFPDTVSWNYMMQ